MPFCVGGATTADKSTAPWMGGQSINDQLNQSIFKLLLTCFLLFVLFFPSASANWEEDTVYWALVCLSAFAAIAIYLSCYMRLRLGSSGSFWKKMEAPVALRFYLLWDSQKIERSPLLPRLVKTPEGILSGRTRSFSQLPCDDVYLFGEPCSLFCCPPVARNNKIYSD